jgi:hypothetical protein
MKNGIKMFALVNLNYIKHVSYYRRDCVKAGKEMFLEESEYRKFVRNGWLKTVPCDVRFDGDSRT